MSTVSILDRPAPDVPESTDDDDLRIAVANVLLGEDGRKAEWVPYADLARQIVGREKFEKGAMDDVLRLWLSEGVAEKRNEGGSLWRIGSGMTRGVEG